MSFETEILNSWFPEPDERPLIVALTGAGMSAESGLKTFRDNDGLWENHDVTQVATPEAWTRNPELVSRFYNQRRTQLGEVQPNAAHLALAELEQQYRVLVITQNVDDLHERAGSTKVLHLHGKLTEMRSSGNPNLIYEVGYVEIEHTACCEEGHPLRPNIVWFGEDVPQYPPAAALTAAAQAVLIIGTSLAVYPAAGLMHYAPNTAPVVLINPRMPEIPASPRYFTIEDTATVGMPTAVQYLSKHFAQR